MRFLIVTPLNPLNQYNGAHVRVREVIENIRQMGQAVDLVYTCQDIGPVGATWENRLTENLAKIADSVNVFPSSIKIKNEGVINALDDFLPYDVRREIERVVSHRDPDCILVNYVFLSGILTWLKTGATCVIDTHDKLSRKDVYEAGGMKPGFFCTTEEDELVGLSRADGIVCIQNNEADYFRKCGIKNVFTIGHLVKRQFLDKQIAPKITSVGFLGSKHVFNTDGVQALLEHKNFRGVNRAFEWIFAGTISEAEAVQSADVTRLGKVDSPKEFYEKVDVVVNPVRHGTGLKIKTVEALSYGVPIVGTKCAFEGIQTPSQLHQLTEPGAILLALEEMMSEPDRLPKLANVSRATFLEYRRQVVEGYDQLLEFVDEAQGVSRSACIDNSRTRRDTIHHVLNPVAAGYDSDLWIAQPLTFESIERARVFHDGVNPDAGRQVSVHAVMVGDEQVAIEPIREPVVHRINRTAREILGRENARPLPAIKDIIRPVVEQARDEDVIVYTNVDIGVQPQFYDYVRRWFENGNDGLVINRRTIGRNYGVQGEHSDVVSDVGKPHPGFDCFAARARAFRRFVLGDTVIGTHLIGRVILWNVAAMADNWKLVRDGHLTFHVGDDNTGKDEKNNYLVVHNHGQAVKTLKALRSDKFLEALLEKAPEALKTYYKPSMIRNSICERKRSVFIHSMFRVASSYFWGKLRSQPATRAYYEPLHETLAGLKRDCLSAENQRTSSFHSRLPGYGYWDAYAGVIEDNGGVARYEDIFAYDQYVVDEQAGTRLYHYILNLMRDAQPNRSIFQINRSSLRQQWFSQQFPDAYHYYLVREPRSQFESYYSSYKNTGAGFIRTDFAIVDLHASNQRFRGLERLVALPRLRRSDHGERAAQWLKAYDDVVDRYSVKDMYRVFFWHWCASLAEALAAGVRLVNVTRVSKDIVYRREIEGAFLDAAVYLDLDDCDLPGEKGEGLGPQEASDVEDEVLEWWKPTLINHERALTQHALSWVLSSYDEHSVSGRNVRDDGESGRTCNHAHAWLDNGFVRSWSWQEEGNAQNAGAGGDSKKYRLRLRWAEQCGRESGGRIVVYGRFRAPAACGSWAELEIEGRRRKVPLGVMYPIAVVSVETETEIRIEVVNGSVPLHCEQASADYLSSVRSAWHRKRRASRIG